MELHFSEYEMMEFLTNKGYKIELVKGWRSHLGYTSHDNYKDDELYIAWFNFSNDARPTELIESGNLDRLHLEYGIEDKFRKQLHRALLKL